MEHTQAVRLIFYVALLTLINMFTNVAISRADQVYNFYFNPEGGALNPISQPLQQQTQVGESIVQSEAPPIKPRDPASTTSYLPKAKVAWSDDTSLLRLGFYLFGSFGHKSSYYQGSEGRQLEKSAGGILALQVFPSKFWGLFGEGITDKEFSNLSYAVGTEIIPLHLSLFGYEDLVAFGGELGWSSYKRLVVNPSAYKEYEMQWFAGAKTHFKLADELYADIGIRKSFDAPIWAGTAGLSLHF